MGQELALGFSSRLKELVQHHGGVTAVSEKSGISRAQLARYLAGSPVPSNRLRDLGFTLGVSTAWLMGEEEQSQENAVKAALRTQQTCKVLLDCLQRFTTERAFLNDEIAQILRLILLSESFAISEQGGYQALSMDDVAYGLHYMGTLLQDNRLETYIEGCEYVLQHGKQSVAAIWAHKWATVVQDAFRAMYDSAYVEVSYYQRLNLPIWGTHLTMMQAWGKLLVLKHGQREKIDVLDAGCGNGRHLIFLHNMSDRFRLKGCETSRVALKICGEHEARGGLPKGSVVQGDFFQLPFADESFDAYQCITNLQFIPLVEGSCTVGVGLALREAHRVLRPGGHALLLVQALGHFDEFFPRFQFAHDANMWAEMMREVGFKVIERAPMELKDVKLPGARYGRGVHHQEMWILEKIHA